MRGRSEIYASILGIRMDERSEPSTEDVAAARTDGHVH
jgi:hypothetical protein